jgi:uncharacterized membrane protein YhaH (DUF805 family)
MNFFEAVCSAFQKYFQFLGRASRSEYWWFYLFVLVGQILVNILDVALLGYNPDDPEDIATFSAIFMLTTLIPSFSVFWRRMHDVDRSGWWWLLCFTIIGIIPVIYWLCKRGDLGQNRFGDDPLAQAV